MAFTPYCCTPNRICVMHNTINGYTRYVYAHVSDHYITETPFTNRSYCLLMYKSYCRSNT